MNVPGKIIATLLILAGCAGATSWLYANKPKTKKTRPKKPVPIVSVMEVSPSDQVVSIEAFGTVIPARKTTLSTEVEGRLTSISPELVPGGIVRKGEFLAQIDPEDYELLVKERKAELVDAQYQLQIEKGKQIIAKREWELFEKNIGNIEANKDLALREPHLENAKAKIEAAKSRLAAAELARKRTTINSPFNAIILEEFAETGQWIGRQTPIATLVDTDQFWVQVSLSPSELSRLIFPSGSSGEGSKVEIIIDTESNARVTRQGQLFKLLGDLDPKGRMARVLVTINDPLELDNDDTPEISPRGRILLGSYVKVLIVGGILKGVYSIPREALRGSNNVWILNQEGELDIRQADIRWRRKDDLLVTMDITPGERIITSRIGSPLPGMLLRTAENTS